MESLAVGFLFFVVVLGLASLLLPVLRHLWSHWALDSTPPESPADQLAAEAAEQLSLDELGLKAECGDTSDQGAVDVAIKIRDLQLFQQQAKNSAEFSYYGQQILQQCDLLVDLTLIQVAPLDIPDHEQFITPDTSNLIYFPHNNSPNSY